MMKTVKTHYDSTEACTMDSYENLRKRLIPDTDAELDYFLDLFRAHSVPGAYCAMEPHFAIAKEKPEGFRNHPTVLALSFGGSNTKVMLAHMKDGVLWAEYLHAQANPDTRIHLYDYLDQIIREQPVVDRYLRETPRPEIGVSIPMIITDECPIHPTKIPTIDGFIARTREEIGEALRFPANFARYMESRGYPMNYHLYYQSDGLVAHHGAASMSDATVRDKTILCVCGTGMATGDEKNYLPIALVCNLPEDDDLFPPEETENRQLHYALAGKGLFSLMRRTIETKVRLGGSALEGKDLRPFFATPKDSRNVFEVCQSAMGLPYDAGRVGAMREAAGEEGFAEMQELSRIIVRRVCETLANTILSTAVSMGPLEDGGSYVVFLEGSIARNPMVKEAVFRDVREKATRLDLRYFDGSPFIFRMVEDPVLRLTRSELPELQDKLSSVDVTLEGAATMVMADVLR